MPKCTNQIGSYGKWVHLSVVELNDEIVCVGLYTECCGIVQNLFSATKTEFLNGSPNSLKIDFVRLCAKKRGNEVLHLGGGVGASKDTLYDFKASFSKESQKFLTIRLIIDEEKYHHLVELRAKSLNIQAEELLKSNFFPAYRYINK